MAVPWVNDQWHLLGPAIRRTLARLPDHFDPYTSYKWLVRWRRAGGRHHSVLAPAHDAAVQTIDTSIFRVRPRSTCFSLYPTELASRSTFFNRIKQYRGMALLYERLAANYLAFVQLA